MTQKYFDESQGIEPLERWPSVARWKSPFCLRLLWFLLIAEMLHEIKSIHPTIPRILHRASNHSYPSQRISVTSDKLVVEKPPGYVHTLYLNLAPIIMYIEICSLGLWIKSLTLILFITYINSYKLIFNEVYYAILLSWLRIRNIHLVQTLVWTVQNNKDYVKSGYVKSKFIKYLQIFFHLFVL